VHIIGLIWTTSSSTIVATSESTTSVIKSATVSTTSSSIRVPSFVTGPRSQRGFTYFTVLTVHVAAIFEIGTGIVTGVFLVESDKTKASGGSSVFIGREENISDFTKTAKFFADIVFICSQRHLVNFQGEKIFRSGASRFTATEAASGSTTHHRRVVSSFVEGTSVHRGG